MSSIQKLSEYFEQLGLGTEVADVYIALHRFGPQTISELSRNAHIERTRLYRLMDVLTTSGLIEVETQYKRSILHAAPIGNLQILLSQKEQQLRDMHSQLKDLEQLLSSQQMQSATTKVQFYQGAEGIKQMMWNQTKARTEVLCILYENMQNRTKLSYFERWVRRCNEHGLRFRGIIGDNFIDTQQQWYGKHSNERLANWQSRYVSADIFPITHSITMYDDVTTYYNWKGDEVFGIEITNNQITGTQRQFFEMLWQQARDVDDLKGIK